MKYKQLYNYKILPNKNLKITASNEGREELKELYLSERAPIYIASDIFEYLGLDEISPENIGALTSAPIIGDDVYWDDDNKFQCSGNVWWYPNYMLTDPMKELKNKGRVIFQNSINA